MEMKKIIVSILLVSGCLLSFQARAEKLIIDPSKPTVDVKPGRKYLTPASGNKPKMPVSPSPFSTSLPGAGPHVTPPQGSTPVVHPNPYATLPPSPGNRPGVDKMLIETGESGGVRGNGPGSVFMKSDESSDPRISIREKKTESAGSHDGKDSEPTKDGVSEATSAK
jgi:hypothetical protein